MSSRIRPRLFAILLATGVASACGGADAFAQPTRPLSPEEMEAIYAARAESALTRFSAADVAFVSGMIHHHAQAITMSEMAPTHGASDVVRTLAARIINGQVDEILTMQEWLAERGQPVPEVPEIAAHLPPGVRPPSSSAAADHAGHEPSAGSAGDMAGHEGHEPAVESTATDHSDHAAHADHSDMPGMLTPAQLARLDAARGEEFDLLYLALMIRHHEGAVIMVEELFATDGALQDIPLFRLASDIQAEQRSEIERMTLMLKEMTGSPLGPALLDIR